MTDTQRTSGFAMKLDQTIGTIRSLMGHSSDLIVRELVICRHIHTALIYLDGMTDVETIQGYIISPLLQCREEEVSLTMLGEQVIQASEVHIAASLEIAVDQILAGSLLILMDGEAAGLVVSAAKWEDRAVEDSKTQPVIQGPHNAFTEKLRTNTTLVRRRVKDTRLRLAGIQVGKLSKTEIAIMYLEGPANDQLVAKLIGSLNNITEDHILGGENLEEILHGNNAFTVFPRFYNTDRPDTIAAGIMEGRVAIFIDGSPFVLIAPTIFTDFLQSAEDYYQPYVYSSAIRVLRYISLFICLFAPSIYIALTTFHQEMIPTQLLLSLAGQREGTPFPAFMEAVLMEITFEILREAGVRMPRPIGQAISIVGTLVVGQAAVDAGIVSAAMVIVVSLTAIASFVIPSYAMSIPVRLIRFIFMALAASFGAYGITIGLILLVVHLCYLQSFGVPYFTPFAPYQKRIFKDSLFRFPYRDSKVNNSGQGEK
ncbi:spore germination protein [Paenibacillus sp. M1]|uniref:Spore germination protein n=1 Tax=Paenibacillus haidiansis TaxID=1574488 RepID=A0ABU7VSY2_9BACL